MHEECASRLANYPSDQYRDDSCNPVDLLTNYIKISRMGKCAWGTEFEIFVAATLFHCKINVFSSFGGSGRV